MFPKAAKGFKGNEIIEIIINHDESNLTFNKRYMHQHI